MVTSLNDRHSRQLQKICLLCLVLVGVDVAKALQTLLRTPRIQPSTNHDATKSSPNLFQYSVWQRFSVFSGSCSAYQPPQSSGIRLSRLLIAPCDLEEQVETKPKSPSHAVQRFPSRLIKSILRVRRWRPLRWFRRNKKSDAEQDSSLPTEDILESHAVDSTILHDDLSKVDDHILAVVNVPTTTASRKGKASFSRPKGKRWAVSAPNIDFTGTWSLINTEEFRKEYDEYLTRLGQPLIVRSVALSIIGLTSEQFTQSDDGRELCIRGQNFRGVWERTLIASAPESDKDADSFEPTLVEIVSADSEKVFAEAWWEKEGTVHRSWIRGVTKYGGGDFESIRYLDDNGRVMVCESTFHPTDENQPKANVTWRFQRSDKK